MSTNQNTTRESSKRCSKKVFSIIALVIVSVFALAIPCAALTLDSDDIDFLYPTFRASGDYHFYADIVPSEGFSIFLGNNGSEVYSYSELSYNENIFVSIENNNGVVDVFIDDVFGAQGTYTEYDSFATFSDDFKMFQLYDALGYGGDDFLEPLPLYYLYVWDEYSGINYIPYYVVYDVTFYGVNSNGISSGLDYQPLVLRYTLDYLSTGSTNGEIGLYLPSIDDVLPLLYDFYLDSYDGSHFQYPWYELPEHDYVTYLYDNEGNKILLDFKDILSIVNWQSTVLFSNNRPSKIQFESGLSDANFLSRGQEELKYIYYESVLDLQFDGSNGGLIAEAIKDTEYPNTRLLGWLGSAVRGFLSVEIFPNFSLGAILGVITMIPIVLWLLKLVAGG